jgi:hypothetical protein
VDFRVAARPTPTPWPPPTLDLVAEGMEVVQVLQDATLIEDKRTLVRVYVGVRGVSSPVRGVNGILWRDGHPGDVIEAMNRGTVELQVESDPMNAPDVVGNLDHTLNFLLPDAWATTDEFWVHINTSAGWVVSVPECAGCNVNNQIHEEHVFHAANPLHVTLVDVTCAGISPPIVNHADVYRWAHTVYPISELTPHADTLSVSYELSNTTFITRICGSGWSMLLDDLQSLRDHTTLPADDVKYYGIVDDAVAHCWTDADGDRWCTGGCGRTGGNVAAGLVDPANTARAGRILAHEIGHNLGRSHTCGCNEPGCVNQHPGGVLGVYGVDLENPSAPVYLDPTTYHDIMTYCPDRWISDITYQVFVDYFVPSAARRAAGGAEGAETEYLVGSGTIVDGLVTMPRPFYRLIYPAGTSDGPGAGPYALELQDASGTPLFTRHFETGGESCGLVAGDCFQEIGPCSPVQGDYFHEIVPWQAGTARIVIKEGETVLHVTHVSANAPEVTLLSPSGGEAWPPYGEHAVSWVGSDADGDPLRYALSYSGDGGETWKAVVTNLTKESYTVDAGHLPGSETALLRVVASDGVNTGHADSAGTFTVEGKPPEPLILYPVDGSSSPPGRPVILEGSGTDMEDGPLVDDALFTWSSDLEGELGVGRELYFDDLAPGQHTITLEVADSDGFVAQASVSIFIGHPVYLPVILKTH